MENKGVPPAESDWSLIVWIIGLAAQAISANPDWLVSHDKEHFVGNPVLNDLSFKIGTPGDVIAWLREYLSL